MASAIVWLVDADNNWVTGQFLGIDGGLGTLSQPLVWQASDRRIRLRLFVSANSVHSATRSIAGIYASSTAPVDADHFSTHPNRA